MKAISLVVVSKGVAEVYAPAHVQTVIVDMDNIEEGDSPVELPANIGFEELVERANVHKYVTFTNIFTNVFTIVAINILWDTYGEDVDFPKNVKVVIPKEKLDDIDDNLADWLSDHFGWHVFGVDFVSLEDFERVGGITTRTIYPYNIERMRNKRAKQ